MYKIDEIKMLRLGQRDENLARSLPFDCSDWLEQYPEASIHILFRRPGESAIVPMSTTLEGTTLTWLIHDFEVGKTGIGNAEFRAVDTAGLRRKSRIIPCSIEETLLGDDETVLYTQDQVDETLAHIGEAAQSALSAKASEEAAALSAQEAADAAGSIGTAVEDTREYKEAAEQAARTAQTAQEGAEAAQSGVHADAEAAEQAKVAAQAAQAGAQGAASQASADRVAAETARTDAEAAATHAEAVVDGIDQAGADQVAAVNAAGQAQVSAVNQAGTTQVGNVNAAGTTQVNAVQAKGTQVINSIPADYSALSGDVTDLKSAMDEIGIPTATPKNYADEAYADVLTGVSVVSDAKIKAGERLANVNVYANAAFGSGRIYLVDDNNKCVKRWEVTGDSGWNNIAINYTTDIDARIGFYNIPIKYINGSSVGKEYVFSANGLNSVSPLSPTAGDTVTISKRYSGKWALSLNWTTESKYIKQIDENTSDIDSLSKAISSEYVQPKTYDDLTKYANVLSGLSSLSGKEIPGNSLISSVELYSAGSQNGRIFVIRKSDNMCVYRKNVVLNSGWNTIEINYFADAPCYIGQYSTGVKYTNTSVDAEHTFSTKIHSTTPYSPTVGETVTISDNYSGNFALSMKWNVKSGIPALSDAIVEINAKKESQKIYDHTCIVSIIDDDTGKYVPSIWGDILAQTSIRMGFACVTGFMAGLETPPEIYEQMSLEDLRNLYNAGHEVYSHSYSHPAFYSTNTTLAEIERQCRLSKQWLESNGFSRNADTIVYPGGLGEAQTEKQDVVRQFYHFGVDTVGGGINPEPLKNDLCIYRVNADTATFEELQTKVDDAITERKLLVFMNHAYELNRDRTAQVQKMIDIINYIKNQGGLIIPLNEALHRIYGW